MPDDEEKPYKDMTADEVYERSKEAAGKPVAAAAGTLEGATRTMDEQNLPQKATDAIQETAHTTRQIAGTAIEEASKTKDRLKEKKDFSG